MPATLNRPAASVGLVARAHEQGGEQRHSMGQRLIGQWAGGNQRLPLLGEGVSRAAAKLGIDPVKPITLLGVSALGEPDLLVEVEATAVID